MYQTKNMGLNITEMPKDKLNAFSFHTDLGYNFESIDSLALSHRNITNCLLEVPQDIKLEIVNGAAVLKAGSKVYTPNGDTTEEQEIYTDLINSTVGEGDVLLAVNKDGNLVAMKGQSYTVSERPEAPIVYLLYHNTTTNRIELSDGSAWYSGCSYPIAIATRTNTGFSKIKQVFNGFGYIGSTVFALPGVKGLVPNGRNDDETLKNITFVTRNVITRSFTKAGTSLIFLNENSIGHLENHEYKYNLKVNRNYGGNVHYNSCFISSFTLVNNAISDFQPRTPFHAVDYNDYHSKITELEAKIETLQAAVKALQG